MGEALRFVEGGLRVLERNEGETWCFFFDFWGWAENEVSK